MNVLVVIDLQNGFKRAIQDNPTIENTKKLIRLAQLKNDIIFFLEFNGFGSTDKRLNDLIKDYNNFHRATKTGCSGAFHVQKIIKKHEIKEIIVCGCYTSECVLETTKGLLRYGHKVKVIKPACFDTNKNQWKQFDIIKKYKESMYSRYLKKYIVPNLVIKESIEI